MTGIFSISLQSIFSRSSDGEVVIYPGNYTRLRLEKEKAAALSDAVLPVTGGSAGSPEKAARRKPAREKPNLTFSEKTELERLPAEIAALAAERNEIEKSLSSPDVSHADISELSARLARVLDLTDSKELRWLELSEKAEG